jgi:hypothetical protein
MRERSFPQKRLLPTQLPERAVPFMDRLWGAGVAVLLVAIVFFLMWRGWQRRVRRDATRASISEQLEFDLGDVLGSWRGLYVSTSERLNVLERIAAPGLAFRAQARIVLAEQGLVFELRGENATVIPLANVDGVATTQLTIDKVVERGGLTVIDWRIPGENGELDVSSFFRLSTSERDSLVAALQNVLTPKLKETT